MYPTHFDELGKVNYEGNPLGCGIWFLPCDMWDVVLAGPHPRALLHILIRKTSNIVVVGSWNVSIKLFFPYDEVLEMAIGVATWHMVCGFCLMQYDEVLR